MGRLRISREAASKRNKKKENNGYGRLVNCSLLAHSQSIPTHFVRQMRQSTSDVLLRYLTSEAKNYCHNARTIVEKNSDTVTHLSQPLQPADPTTYQMSDKLI